MKESSRTVTEFYALLLNADYSFLRMNKTLHRYHYEVCILPLDEAEIKFREVFGLPAYKDQEQDRAIPFSMPSGALADIAITQELHDRILLERPDSPLVLSQGYLVCLRKRKFLDLPASGRIADAVLIPEMEAVRLFTQKIENSLRLSRQGSIVFRELFACIPGENRIVRTGITASALAVTAGRYEFLEKDNYALKTWLNADHKISDNAGLAIQTFLESFYVRNIRLRYLQLLLVLEVCFNAPFGAAADTICRSASILLAQDKSQFLALYDEIHALCCARRNVMHGGSYEASPQDFSDEQLDQKAGRLEDLTRDILKKIVKINPKKRGNLIEELKNKRL